MKDEKDLQTAYRFDPRGSGGKPRPPKVEEEREHCSDMIHRKLSPKKLNRVSLINIAVLGGILLVFFLGSIFLEKPKVSEVEKRDLQKMPEFSLQTLFDGSFTRNLETYFSDTFPVRDWFVNLSAVVDESKGVRVDDVRIIQPTNQNNEAQAPVQSVEASASLETSPNEGESSTSGESSSAQSTATTQFASGGEGEVGAISNGTFVYKGMAMSLFGGSKQSAGWYADVLNTYREELPDVQIYNMIIPTSIEFNVPEKYRDLTQSQKDVIDLVYGSLDSGIKKVDAYSKLKEHKDEYLYFRTDHHWTGLGAYYAYTAFCEQAGFTPIKLEDTETRRLDNFIGTMYSQTQDSTLLENPDYVDYYIFPQTYTATRYDKNAPYSGVPHTLWGEYAKSPNSYSVFLHGDFPLIKVETTNKNGRKIMIVKESFGNAFAPYLINHYEEVYIVDQRYFQLPSVDFIKQNGINELIFANNAFAVCTPYHIQCINNMRHQVFVPYVPPVEPEETESSSEEPDKKSVGIQKEKDETETKKSASKKPSKSASKKAESQNSSEE